MNEEEVVALFRKDEKTKSTKVKKRKGMHIVLFRRSSCRGRKIEDSINHQIEGGTPLNVHQSLHGTFLYYSV